MKKQDGLTNYKRTGRHFLNKDLGDKTAYIVWSTQIDQCNHNYECKDCIDKHLCSEYRLQRIDANIQLKDCNDSIKYDFDINGDTSETETYIKNNIKKINMLIREFKKFKKLYIEQIELMIKNKEGLNKTKKRSRKV